VRWNIIAKDCTPDELREEIDRFEDLLVKAWEYSHTFYQRTPVLLHVRAARESGDRYALVDSSPEIDKDSPLFNRAFDEAVLSEMGVGVLRYAWTDTPTGTLPTVEDLSARADAESAPAAPVLAVRGAVGNVRHHAVGTLSDVYAFDASLGTFSGNLVATDSYDLFSVAGAVPAVNDIHYFGGTRPFFTVAGYIGTPGVYSWTEVWELWTGAAWTTMTAGTQYVLYPDATPFKTEGVWAFSQLGGSWQQTAINGVTRYWVRVRISAFTSHTTTPRNEDQRAFALQHPHIVLPSTAVQGDAPPRVLLRMRHGLGATTSPAFGLTNRILAGLKTVESTSLFEAFLNLGGLGNRIQWTTTALTDVSVAALTTAPAGQAHVCDFGTDPSLVPRIRMTGAGLFSTYSGRYRVFLRAKQAGGANGDVEHAIRVFLDSTSGPFIQKPAVAMRSNIVGTELIDLIPNGYLQLPFAEYQTGGGDDFSQADLVIEVLSKRNTGSAIVYYADLILLPVDEWAGEWEDPVSDITTGSSSLRGGTLLEDDGGVLLDRTIKMLVDGSGQLFPAETWTRRGLPIRLRASGDENRLYFLSARFGSSFGAAPLLSTPGQFLLAELYLHNVYRDLRGND